MGLTSPAETGLTEFLLDYGSGRCITRMISYPYSPAAVLKEMEAYRLRHSNKTEKEYLVSGVRGGRGGAAGRRGLGAPCGIHVPASEVTG